MTNPPGEGTPPERPDERRPGDQPGEQPGAGYPGEQPGYWEQQSQQPWQSSYPPQPGYPTQPGQYVQDHPRATTSLVLGILGIVLCQVIAPFAWSIGKKTLQEIDASGGTVGGRGSAQAGYVLGIVGTVLLILGVVFLLIWLIVAVAIFGGGMSTTSSSF